MRLKRDKKAKESADEGSSEDEKVVPGARRRVQRQCSLAVQQAGALRQRLQQQQQAAGVGVPELDDEDPRVLQALEEGEREEYEVRARQRKARQSCR